MLTLDDNHIYRWNGVIKPGVSEILKADGQIEDRFFREVDSERGRRVHLLTQYYDQGTLDETNLAEQWKPYLKAYKDFHRFNRPDWDIDGIEHEFYNERYNFCGTLDRKGTIEYLGRRVRCVLDIKSGVPAPWHGVQLAGYSLPDFGVLRLGLYLRPTGKHELKTYTSQNDYALFIKALNNFWEKKGERYGVHHN